MRAGVAGVGLIVVMVVLAGAGQVMDWGEGRPGVGVVTNEVALRAYHYGSVEIEPSPAEWFKFEDGVITKFEYGMYPDMEHVVIPWEIEGQAVVGIGSFAFYITESSPGYLIESVVLPRSITNIAGSAFSYCTYLTNVVVNSKAKPNFGVSWSLSTHPDLRVVVMDPQAEGWGSKQDGKRVVRPAVYGDNIGGVDEWQVVVDGGAAVEIGVESSRVRYVGAGDATLSLTGIGDGRVVYLVVEGVDSLVISGAYWLGGGRYVAGRVNHYMAWVYGGELLVNAVTTTEVE